MYQTWVDGQKTQGKKMNGQKNEAITNYNSNN